uniref:Candidate secreted effector n=1 Tax=Meloidogyne incognita TaxID=6306 RepID=A0A914NG49_MELIC
MIEPNIPIYLIISGILLIASGVARIFFWLSSDSLTNGRRRGSNSGDGSHVCEYLIEGSILFCIVVIVILGCFWVYGTSRYMQNQRYMFEWHYCNPTVYWTAWWSVTLHLAFFALLFLAVIILLVYGALLG